jgi:hypothetical protein
MKSSWNYLFVDIQTYDGDDENGITWRGKRMKGR